MYEDRLLNIFKQLQVYIVLADPIFPVELLQFRKFYSFSFRFGDPWDVSHETMARITSINMVAYAAYALYLTVSPVFSEIFPFTTFS